MWESCVNKFFDQQASVAKVQGFGEVRGFGVLACCCVACGGVGGVPGATCLYSEFLTISSNNRILCPDHPNIDNIKDRVLMVSLSIIMYIKFRKITRNIIYTAYIWYSIV